MSIINIGLHGASGRMGTAVAEAIAKQSNKFVLVTKFSKRHNQDKLFNFCFPADIIIDFSTPDALENLLKISTEVGKKLVIGTTGLSSAHIKEIEKQCWQSSQYEPYVLFDVKKFSQMMINDCIQTLRNNGYDDAAKCLQDIYFGIEE